MTGAQFDGIVCLGPRGERFGYIVFRMEPGQLSQFECSCWCWPTTDEGRAQARAQMVRTLERLQLEHFHPRARGLLAA